MTLAAFRPFSFLAVAAAFVATSSSSYFASAADWNATTCEELASLPTGQLNEDSTLTIRGPVFTCDEVTTVEVGGSFTLIVYGDVTQVFTNVRFGVTGGAHLFLTGVNTEIRMMRFTGTTNLASNGGVFNVELGSSATVNVVSIFDHNSVLAEYSGGAVYAGGKVNFPYDCTFNENSVMSDENSPSGSGGAVFVEHGGAVLFEGVCDFIYNEVGSGGRGGAIANMGSVVFQGSPGEISFTDNTATAYVSSGGDVTGGHGGAIFTGESGVTSISGFRSASHNSAFSGGALYNSGTTIFTSTTNEFVTEFNDNDANGADAGNGGHIYTAGVVYAEGACGFTYGTATGNGGAVYVENAGSFNSAGQSTYTSNTADGECDDMYVSGGHPVCQPASEASVGKTVRSQ